jgi:hydrogenase maturation protease
MILIIGYGNPLRRDDAIGQHVIEALKQRHMRGDVQLMSVYQLTPELVYTMHEAELVILIDARSGGKSGDIVQEKLQPETDSGAFTHHFSPATLLGAVKGFYGTCPEAILLSIAGSDFDYGETLSPCVRLAVPLVLLAVEEIIRHSTETKLLSERNKVLCGTTA